MRKLLARLAVSAAGLAVAAAATLPFASPASASATGCARWGQRIIFGHSIATGQYCFTVDGSGNHINWTSGSFNTGWIGEPTEIVRFYDVYGNNYANFTTFHGSGTLYGFHYWKTGINGNARTGTICGTLLSYGVQVTAACETIHP